MIRAAGVLLLAAVIPACRPAPVVAPAPERLAAPALPTDAWVGRWVGVEGLALDIRRDDAPGRYRLTVALMDGVERFVGQADGDAIRFVRDGAPAAIRHVAGRDTGLKWLDGKRDCLMIRPGEGFCRD